VNSLSLCYRKQRVNSRSDTTLTQPHSSEHDRSPQDLLSSRPEELNVLLSPYRKSAPTVLSTRPSFLLFIGGSELRGSRVHYLSFGLSNPRDPMRQSTLTSPSAIGTSLYRVFATRDTKHSGFQPPIPMRRNADNSRSRSLATSLLARPNDSYSSTPDARDAETPISMPPVFHYPAVAHTIHAIVGTSLLAISRLPLRKFGVLPHELPICRSTSRTNAPRDPDRRLLPS
jgi:hypothetical protein